VASTARPLPPLEVEARLRARFGDDVLSFEDQFGHAVVAITPARYRELVTFLRDEPEFACDYCDFTAGVDLGEDGMQVVTHLHSTSRSHDVRVKVLLPADDPVCPTISDLYPTANWHEREAAEMFGIAPQGLPADVAGGQALAGCGRGRGGGRGVIAQAGVSYVDQWLDGYWLVLVVKAAIVLVFFLTAPLAVGYAEHKVLAHMQARLGPMYAGAFHGWAQLVADGVKFVQKEDIIPAAADRWVFSLAPAVALVPYIAVLVVIPFSDQAFVLNLDVGIFFVMAMTSITVIGVLMAGWASANKFSLIGALRAAAQLIAYELPLVLAAAAVVMQAATLSMIGIVQAQEQYWFVFSQPIGFFIFMVASLAELTRPPFDMPVADSEIIFGAYTEYTGLKFAFFLLAEYGGIVVLSAVASVLYLGGYLGLPGMEAVPAPLWMFAKIGALSFLIIWLRATYPRLREDQLQRMSWLVLIPLALVQIMGVAVLKVAV